MISDLDANMQECYKRGYTPLLDTANQVWAFQKGEVFILIDSCRGSGAEYFKALLDQKEREARFQFEVILP